MLKWTRNILGAVIGLAPPMLLGFKYVSPIDTSTLVQHEESDMGILGQGE